MDTAKPPDLRSGIDPVALMPFAPAHRDGAPALPRGRAWPWRIKARDLALSNQPLD